jgi:hypothetical protein
VNENSLFLMNDHTPDCWDGASQILSSAPGANRQSRRRRKEVPRHPRSNAWSVSSI